MNKQKLIGLILGIVLFIVAIAGLTYAYVSWTSDNMNKVVSSKCFNVLYDKGKDFTGDIPPSVDYTGGISVSVKMNIDSSCDMNAKGKIYLNVDETTSENLFKEGLLNYQVLINGGVTEYKGSITNYGDIVIDVGFLNKSTVATTTYTVYVWINGDYVENKHARSSFHGSIRSEAVQSREEPSYDNTIVTPISDFTYILGSEQPTVSALTTCYYGNDAYGYSFEECSVDTNYIAPISLGSNEILLVRYNGESDEIMIPNTYIVNNATYNVVILSYVSYLDGGYEGFWSGLFYKNTNIRSVIFGDDIKFLYSEGYYDRYEESGEEYYVSTVHENNANSLFFDCTNLVNVPLMPDSVTSMNRTFLGCTNLTDTIRINSSNVTDLSRIFYNTSKPITVEVPAGSTTYTNISKLTISDGMPSNVTLSTFDAS